MDKKRMKDICFLFFDAGKNNCPDSKFKIMFEHYWKEINKNDKKLKNRIEELEEEKYYTAIEDNEVEE